MNSLSSLILICPRCRRVDQDGTFLSAPLHLEGGGPDLLHPFALDLRAHPVLECSNDHCAARYPIIDGIPVVFKHPEALDLALSPPFDVLELGTDRLLALLDGQDPARALPALVARLARYAWAAFHDGLSDDWHLPGVRCEVHGVALMRWLETLGEATRCSSLPRVLLGSALGREAWQAAAGDTLLLDAHLPSLLAGMRLLERGRLELVAPLDAKRWIPLHIEAPPAPAGAVHALCCDVLDPPLAAGAFGSVIAPNLVDSVSDPFVAIGQAHALTASGGMLTLTSPFSWRPEVTPRDRWLELLGGAPMAGPAEVLELLLATSYASPMQAVGRTELLWMLRSSPRETVLYHSFAMAFEGSETSPEASTETSPEASTGASTEASPEASTEANTE